MTADTFIIGVFIFLTVLMIFGGLFSLALHKVYVARNPRLLEETHHRPKWAKDLSIMPRHRDCSPCEVEVIKLKETRARRETARRS